MRMRTKCDKHVYHIVHKFMQKKLTRSKLGFD